MPIGFHIYKKKPLRLESDFRVAEAIATQLKAYLDTDTVCSEIKECHVLNGTSQQVQAIVNREAERLGFQPERKGLFTNYQVSALRPDFYLPIGKSGIILEVERGKTITNNMDLLDIWKCHVCPHADFLFLIVPMARPSENGSVIKAYDNVLRRLATFFEPQNYVNVEAVFIFGY